MMNKIKIYKQMVYDDIDALTYKRVNVEFAGKEEAIKFEVSSDSHDEFDKGILYRMLGFRNAKLCKTLGGYLASGSETGSVDNRVPIEDEGCFEYSFCRDLSKWDMNILMEYIHRYLVLATAFDWYDKMNLKTSISQEEIDGLLSDIRRTLMPAYVKTPIQPFGPEY